MNSSTYSTILFVVGVIFVLIIILLILIQGYDAEMKIIDHKKLENGLDGEGYIYKTYINVLLYKIKKFQKTKSTLLGKIIYYNSLPLPIISTIILTIIMTIIKTIVKIINIIYKKNFNLKDDKNG